MPSKNETIALLNRYGARPIKRLGQNFLIDDNIGKKIIDSLSLEEDDVVVEIGPGLGSLTFGIAERAAKVFAVEKDRLLYKILCEISASKPPGLKIIQGDILDQDLSRLAGAARVKIVGNLPYYVTTPILEYLIENKSMIESAAITIQKEVASRILAKPGSKEFGALSCFIQYHAQAQYLYTIKPTVFYPQPEVDSSLVRLDFPERPSVNVGDEELFFRIIRKAFNQRRKTIANSLTSKALGTIAPKERLIEALSSAGISPSARPEDLGLDDFARIAESLH